MRRRAYCVLLALLLLRPAAFGQQTQQRNRDSYSIRGKLIVPLAGMDQRIEVNLERSTMQVIQTSYTDSTGNFEFRGLPAGIYFIAVNMDGYEPVHQPVELAGAFTNGVITIFMNKPAVTIRDRPTGLDAADPDVVDVSQMRENFPKRAVQQYDKALAEKEKGRLEAAAKLLEEAVGLAPNFFHAHNNLGVVYQSLKRYPEAEREFKRSREISPKSDRPLINLGGLYIEQADNERSSRRARGRWLDQALDSLEEAVRLNPRSVMAHFLLGQANYKSDFLEEAEAAFKKAHEIDPRFSTANLMLANVYSRQHRWDDVIQLLDEYLRENPKASDRASVEQMRAAVLKNAEAASAGDHHP
jgi:tetratricopeptide (TPR) repeat protein